MYHSTEIGLSFSSAVSTWQSNWISLLIFWARRKTLLLPPNGESMTTVAAGSSFSSGVKDRFYYHRPHYVTTMTFLYLDLRAWEYCRWLCLSSLPCPRVRLPSNWCFLHMSHTRQEEGRHNTTKQHSAWCTGAKSTGRRKSDFSRSNKHLWRNIFLRTKSGLELKENGLWFLGETNEACQISFASSSCKQYGIAVFLL